MFAGKTRIRRFCRNVPLRNMSHCKKFTVLVLGLTLVALYGLSMTSYSTVQQDNKISVLWYTRLRDDRGSGFMEENINFMIPLSEVLEFGWYARESISDVMVNNFFRNQTAEDQEILRGLYVEGARMHELLGYGEPDVIAIVFEKPSQYKDIFENTRLKHSVYKVGRAMFETNWIPAGWEYCINEYLDELWVPSTFAKEVFESAGVYKPIHVIREGFDSKRFEHFITPQERVSFRKLYFPNCLEDDLIFFSVGKMERRKGIDLLFKAFENTFRSDPNKGSACLYIRTDMTECQQKEAAKKFNDTGLRIFTKSRLPNQDLMLAYQSSDVFILPTHGEGWGRPIMEAMAAGKPVVVPIWSGVSEFVKEEYAIPLHVDKLEPAFIGESQFLGGDRYKELHQWASISPTNLEEVLQWCIDNRKFLPDIGTKARTAMYANFTRETVAQEAKTRIEEIILKLNTEGLLTYRKWAARKAQVHQQEQEHEKNKKEKQKIRDKRSESIKDVGKISPILETPSPPC